jgi:ABC-type dipeptide/oligopeptide/nickel transport system permease component
MSYQPPFDGNWMTQNAWMNRNDRPPSIRSAVRFIYAGAAMQALFVIFEIATVRGRIESILTTSSATPLTPSQLNTTEAVSVGFLVLGGVVGASLWLWMARKNKAGRRWARILSTVAFAILTFAQVAIIAQPIAVENKIIPVAEWVVGLLAIVLLWQRESSDFYAARSYRF